MTGHARKTGLISEQSIKAALVESKGDIFLAACALECTPRELDSYIRRSAGLQGFITAVETVKVDPAYSRLSAEQFENHVGDLVRAFRVDGIQEVHKLATMEFGDSAALAKVKLDAALALTGSTSHRGGSNEVENTLAELNALYHANAPRIKEIRKTVITFEDGQAETPLALEMQTPPR
jgi:hypothetical protein